MISEGRASGPVARGFAKVLDDGIERTRESARESGELVRETRAQLLVVLRRQGRGSGAVARSLIERPRRTEAVFGTPLVELLASVYGDAERGFALAVEDLLGSGHFERAGSILARKEVRDWAACRQTAPFAAGMAAYYAGDEATAVARLGEWVAAGAPGPSARGLQAGRALRQIANPDEAEDLSLSRAAAELAGRLEPSQSAAPTARS